MPDQPSDKTIRVSRFQRDVLGFLKLVAKYGGAHLTCNQMILLGEVWIAHAEGRPLFAADLQAVCNMPKSTTSRVVSSLGEDGLGFLVVSPDPQDRRRKRICPSNPLIELNDRMSEEFRRLREVDPE